jgi:hypothetical protein
LEQLFKKLRGVKEIGFQSLAQGIKSGVKRVFWDMQMEVKEIKVDEERNLLFLLIVN